MAAQSNCATFVVRYTYATAGEIRRHHQPAHREYLNVLTESGYLLVAGPIENANSGVLILRANDEAQLSELLSADPYAVHDMIDRTEVLHWVPRVGVMSRDFQSLVHEGKL